MFQEYVTVTSVSDTFVTVTFTKKTMCDCCRYKTLCGKGEEELSIAKPADMEIAVGDTIEIAIEEKKNILAGILLFILPTSIFIGIIALTPRVSELNRFLLALCGLFVYYGVVKWKLKTWGKYFQLQIVRNVGL